jgi:hypothetical protein
MGIKLQMVSAGSIMQGDTFMHADGRPAWVAIEDAEPVTIDGEDFIEIAVQHYPDGGRERRLFPAEMEWSKRYVKRAE